MTIVPFRPQIMLPKSEDTLGDYFPNLENKIEWLYFAGRHGLPDIFSGELFLHLLLLRASDLGFRFYHSGFRVNVMGSNNNPKP